MSMRTKKVMDFSRSESSSSLESEIPTRGFDDDDDDDEAREYRENKEELYSSGVNFQPIRPLRSCQTLASSLPVKNSSSIKDTDETTREAGGKAIGAPNAAVIVAMIDQKMKEHTSNLLHAAHGISARITQVESRRRQLENLIDDVKDSIEFYHGRTERRLRELEDIMTEVQVGIKDFRDKQEIAEAQLQLAILQLSSVHSQSKFQNNSGQIKQVQQLVPYVHQPDQQQYPSPAAGQQRHCDVPPIAPPNPHHQTLVDQAVRLPQRLGQNQSQSIQQPQTWYQTAVPVPDSANQKNHMFPTQSSVTPHQPYMQSSVFPSPQLWYAPRMVSPPQQFYSQNINNQSLDSSLSKFHLEHSEPHGNFHSVDPCEESPFQYWNPAMKTSQPPFPSSSVTSSDCCYTPSSITKDVPRAIPMATNLNDASKSDGSGTTEDIVEKVVAMGFRRDIVKATIRKLTDAGQSVDLNVVLDKLFNNT